MTQPKDWTREEAERLRLIGAGEECQHPMEFRRPLPIPSPFRDPDEWECGVCEIWQVADGQF